MQLGSKDTELLAATCYRLQQKLLTNLHKWIQISCHHISINSWFMAKSSANVEKALVKCPLRHYILNYAKLEYTGRWKHPAPARLLSYFQFFQAVKQEWMPWVKAAAHLQPQLPRQALLPNDFKSSLKNHVLSSHKTRSKLKGASLLKGRTSNSMKFTSQDKQLHLVFLNLLQLSRHNLNMKLSRDELQG